MKPIITIENLCFGYHPERMIFDNLSLEVMEKEFWAIAGPNGVGKTTLLKLLCGLLKAKRGYVKIESKNISTYSAKKLAQKVAIVRQEFLPVFDFKVSEIVSMARIPYLSTFGFEEKVDYAKIEEAFELTGTAELAARNFGGLSSGERQRVLIAKALAQDTPILLFDEPTSFLDLRHQIQMYDLLRRMQLEKKKTVLVITHDINLAVQYCDKVLLLGDHCKFQYGITEEVLRRDRVEKIFNVNIYSATARGKEYFIHLGKYTKNRDV